MDVHRLIRRRFKVRPGASLPQICPRGGRKRLADVFCELGYTRGVEIGTRRGSYAVQLSGSIPGLHLTCVDPWHAFNRVTAEQQDRYYAEAKQTLDPLGVNILRMTSSEALSQFRDGSLDFVFIDGAHEFDYVMRDIIEWNRKVKKGGILAGHDYSMFPDVARAADAYAMCHNIRPWYLVREYESTFFWVVE